MSPSKYSQYVVQDLKEPFPPEIAKRYATIAKRVLWIDNKLVPGAFQMNCSWYFKKLEKGPEEHVHDSNEILGFFGNDPNDPYNLHGEVEFWLGGKKQVINRTAMVFIPSGMRHCPLILKRVDRPIFHFSVVTEGQWVTKKPQTNNDPHYDYSKHVVTELRAPDFGPKFVEEYKKFATRILWMDKNVVPGAFQMNCAWYCNPQAHAPTPHKHTSDEIIGFFSGDMNNPYDLGAEIEMWLEDEKFILTKSTMLFAPAGMNHCPLIIRHADRPVFHFSVVTEDTYRLIPSETKKND
jgi:mannose-6-phosphate isomerase-like protein (cupin superfamily)